MNKLYNTDCLKYLSDNDDCYTTIFADPPDNIGLDYKNSKDKMPDAVYIDLLDKWLRVFVRRADNIWFSYNAKWMASIGRICVDLHRYYNNIEETLEIRHFIQTFTFGQHRQTDCGNNFRPLLRLRWLRAPLYPDAIRVQSWRQANGDKRADPRGRVPGDVFDFPRVTGNSKQRRVWHPTQLNEGLVERCLRLTCKEGDRVLDTFAGTGTTLRVCKRLGLSCTLLEIDPFYCQKIAEEHNLDILT